MCCISLAILFGGFKNKGGFDLPLPFFVFAIIGDCFIAYQIFK